MKLGMLILFAAAAYAAPIVDPGRIVDLGNSHDPNSPITLAPGERVTSYLSDFPYLASQPVFCPNCPALPNFLSYSLNGTIGNAGDTIMVSLLTYDGRMVINLGGIVLLSTFFVSTDANGNTIIVPVSSGSTEAVAADSSQQQLLFGNLFGSDLLGGRFRADLTNTSNHALGALALNIGFAGIAHIGDATFSIGLSAAQVAPFQPTPVPEPTYSVLLGGVLVALLGARHLTMGEAKEQSFPKIGLL